MSDPTRIDVSVGTTLYHQSAYGKPYRPVGRSGHHRREHLDAFGLGVNLPDDRTYSNAGRRGGPFHHPIPSRQAEYVLKLYRRGLRPKGDVIETLRTCSRQHVIEIIGCGESDGLLYEILEYAKHGTLRDLFRKGPVKDALMLSIVSELLGAVEHIHSRKIIHRDLKPENISSDA